MATTVNVNIKATNKVTRPVNKAGRDIEQLGQRASRAGKQAKGNWGGLADLFTGLLPRGLQSTIRSFKSTQRQIKRLAGGFKVLKGAIAATGLGLLVVALGEIIANWEAITEFFRDKTRENQLKQELKAIEAQNFELSLQHKLQKALTQDARERFLIEEDSLEAKIREVAKQKELASEEAERPKEWEKYHNLRKQQAQLENDLEILRAQEEKRLDTIINKARIYNSEELQAAEERRKVTEDEDAAIKVLEERVRKNEAIVKFNEEQAAHSEKRHGRTAYVQELELEALEKKQEILATNADLQELYAARQAKIAEYEDREAKARRERRRAERKQNEEFLAKEIIKIRQDIELKGIEDEEERMKRQREMQYEAAEQTYRDKGATDAQLAALHEQYMLDIEAIENKYQDKRDKEAEDKRKREEEAAQRSLQDQADLEDELFELQQEGFDKEELALMQQFDQRVALAGENNELILAAEEQFQKDHAALVEKYSQEQTNKQVKDMEDRMSMLQQVSQQGFSILNSIQEIAQADQDKLSKKQFKRNQALAVAETLVSTFISAQLAYRSQLTATPDSPIRATIAAAAAVASGLARVASIKAQKYDSGSGGGGGGGGGRSGFSGPQPQTQAVAPPQRLVSPDQMRAYVVQTDLQGQSEAAGKMQAQTVL